MISGAGKGAAAAMNLGLRYARYPIICQVDQDVVIERGWMARLVTELEDPLVAAVQGQYVNDRRAHWTARVMALDLQQRYASIAGSRIDHVCTGNSAYRASALREVGGFLAVSQGPIAGREGCHHGQVAATAGDQHL